MSRIPTNNLSRILEFVQWHKWYDSKFPFFLVCIFYAGLSSALEAPELLVEMGALLALLCAYACFGHIANDFGDRAIDRAAGKRNLLSMMSDRMAGFAVVISAAVSLLLATLYYRGHPGVIALFWGAHALAAVYSLPPIRLKERGAWGVLAGALGERTLPCLMIFAGLGPWNAVSTTLLLLGTAIGLRDLLRHQVIDLASDRESGTATFGVRRGSGLLEGLVQSYVFPLEVVLIGCALIAMSVELPAVGVMGGLYALWAFFDLCVWPSSRHRAPMSRAFLTADRIWVYWPLVLAAMLAVEDSRFLLVLIVALAWQWPRTVGDLRRIGGRVRGALSAREHRA